MPSPFRNQLFDNNPSNLCLNGSAEGYMISLHYSCWLAAWTDYHSKQEMSQCIGGGLPSNLDGNGNLIALRIGKEDDMMRVAV
jgi:hypothetical protein